MLRRFRFNKIKKHRHVIKVLCIEADHFRRLQNIANADPAFPVSYTNEKWTNFPAQAPRSFKIVIVNKGPGSYDTYSDAKLVTHRPCQIFRLDFSPNIWASVFVLGDKQSIFVYRAPGFTAGHLHRIAADVNKL